MDLRVEKTLAGIKNAYFALKKGKKVSEIKVVDVCEKARINKSTFYKYYLDVYDLAEKIETEIIDSMIDECPKADAFFTDTEGFVGSMIPIIMKYGDLLRDLFDGRVFDEVMRFEKGLLKRYIPQALSERETYLIRFCIGGMAHVLSGEEKITLETVERVKRFSLEYIEKFVFRQKDNKDEDENA